MIAKCINSLFYKIQNFAILSNGAGDVADISDVNNPPSGVWSIIKNFFRFIWQQIVEIILLIINAIAKLLYIIVEFILKLIDLIYVFFKEFAGMNTSSNLLNSEDAKGSDVIFNFLQNPLVKKTAVRILVLALVLLIIFTIIAIIKSEYTAAVTDGNNSKKQILVNTLRSLFLMALVPVIAFGGIIISNVILSSVSSAFSGGTSDINISTQIFLSSSYQANKFRDYAVSDKQIPITYNLAALDEDDLRQLPIDGTTRELEESFRKLATSSAWNIGYTTYMFFYYNEFFTRSEIPDAYYEIYDTQLHPLGSGKNNYIDKVDYYIMADLQDTLLKFGVPFYYVKCTNNLVVNYSGSGKKTYIADKNAFSETEGAVFTIAIKPTEYYAATKTTKYGESVNITSNENIYYYKYYNKNGDLDKNRSKYFRFSSTYLNSGSGVLAKGLMNEDGYPTTIRQNEDGSVVCYRDYINVPVLADIFPRISYEEDPNATQTLGSALLKYGVSTIVGIDANELIPYFYFRFDIWTLFQKTEELVFSLNADTPLVLDYTFSGQTEIEDHYSLLKLNWIVFALVATVMLGILLKSCFGLIMRIFDIVLLFIIYPLIASSLPLDDGERAKQWNAQFIARLFAAYGIVISLNFVFLLVPLIDGINLFDDSMLTGIMGYLPADFVNAMIQILFILVLFTFIKGGISIVSTLFGEDPKKGINIDAFTIGEDNVAKVVGKRNPYTGQLKGGLIGDTRDFVSGKSFSEGIDKVLGEKDQLTGRRKGGMIPGSVLFQKSKDKRIKKFNIDNIANLRNHELQLLNTGDVSKYSDSSGKHAPTDLEKATTGLVKGSDKKVAKIARKSPYKFNR